MNRADPSQLTIAIEEPPEHAPFLLNELEVFNWGPFNGRHRAEINARGSAIIGPTGSGKTTLIDALMTLLTHNPRYNLASTGGHESDRDLMSYVRGVFGADASSVTRSQKAVSGICASYWNGHRRVLIGGILWVDSSSMATSDLKRLWLFADSEEESLESWLTLFREGGSRRLKQHIRDTVGIQFFDSKKSFLAQVRRFFEVGENAFTLLNRAAGLKQLNSIDEIFRELVLDDNSAFESAAQVANMFDDLAAIHEELETARRQQQSLLPIAKNERDHRKITKRKDELKRLQRVLPVWFAMRGATLWQARVEQEQEIINQLQLQIETSEKLEDSLQKEVETLHGIYLKSGGDDIETTRQLVDKQEKFVRQCQIAVADYQAATKKLDLSGELTAQSLQKNQAWVEQEKPRLAQQKELQEQEAYKLGGELVQFDQKLNAIKQDIQDIQERPGSNVPSNFQKFRSTLAEAIEVDEDELPFLAELIEVKSEDSAWRGAIERALGGHRLQILVPPVKMREALRWVNHRDNRLHVRLIEATEPTGSASFFEDGFTRKLQFKTHRFREVVKEFLAGIDRHCVDSAETLHRTTHGMTVEGMLSGKSGRFEKQDQKPLGENWMTGFDNKDQLATLNKQSAMIAEDKKSAQAGFSRVRREVGRIQEKLNLLDQLTQLDFESINLPAQKSELERMQTRLKALLDPNSDASKAKEKHEAAAAGLKQQRKATGSLREERSTHEERHKQATAKKQQSVARITNDFDETELQAAAKQFSISQEVEPDGLDDLERNAGGALNKKLEAVSEKLKTIEKDLIRNMEKAKKVDTGALSEVGTELEDVPNYLERLRELEQEALPEKISRFKEYLNNSSDQGVVQLLAHIDNEVTKIEERIEDLNTTLQRVDFKPDYFLRLEPRRVQHDLLSQLERARRYVRSAMLQDDEGESHFHALQRIVGILRDASENRRTVGARALLDPRYRLNFYVTEVERATGKASTPRSGSQTGSGGEKEIMASYILTASLSYALCPGGMSRPLYGTIVLDEAFSKSSQSAATRIVAALREFGLHPLFVTPNKEMGLLRKHTSSAILVHRKGTQATLTSLSWESLARIRQDTGSFSSP